jgi:tetratricopeptide (TPR) repeat protein
MVSVFWIAGCAGTGGYSGDPLLRDGRYDDAIAAYRAELETNPTNPELRRNLGAALLKSGQVESAVSELEMARGLDPEDPAIRYFLGRAADEAGRSDLALEHYAAYLSMEPRGEVRWVRARMQQIASERALADVRSALQRERELSIDRVPENTVAVPPFANLSGDEELAALSRGLAALVITDLAQVAELRVVEREKLQVLQKEMSLSSPPPRPPTDPTEFQPVETVVGIQQRLQVLLMPGTGEAYYQGDADGTKRISYLEAVKRFQSDRGLTADGIAGPRTQASLEEAMTETSVAPPEALAPIAEVIDPATAARAGRILGARRFIQGSFVPIGERNVQLDASILGAADGAVQPAGEPVEGELRRVMRLEKDLLFSILDALGIEPSPELRRQLEEPATDNFLAFLAYGRGLLLEEEGRMGEALEAYREAVRNDPGFQMAQQQADVLSATPADRDQMDRAALLQTTVVGNDPIDRLLLTGTWGGIGPGPAVDRNDDLYPTVTPAEKVSGGGVIIVEGDLPDRRDAR